MKSAYTLHPSPSLSVQPASSPHVALLATTVVVDGCGEGALLLPATPRVRAGAGFAKLLEDPSPLPRGVGGHLPQLFGHKSRPMLPRFVSRSQYPATLASKQVLPPILMLRSAQPMPAPTAVGPVNTLSQLSQLLGHKSVPIDIDVP